MEVEEHVFEVFLEESDVVGLGLDFVLNLLEEVGGWVGGWVGGGWVGWVEEDEAVRMRCCMSYMGGWVGGKTLTWK